MFQTLDVPVGPIELSAHFQAEVVVDMNNFCPFVVDQASLKLKVFIVCLNIRLTIDHDQLVFHRHLDFDLLFRRSKN